MLKMTSGKKGEGVGHLVTQGVKAEWHTLRDVYILIVC